MTDERMTDEAWLHSLVSAAKSDAPASGTRDIAWEDLERACAAFEPPLVEPAPESLAQWWSGTGSKSATWKGLAALAVVGIAVGGWALAPRSEPDASTADSVGRVASGAPQAHDGPHDAQARRAPVDAIGVEASSAPPRRAALGAAAASPAGVSPPTGLGGRKDRPHAATRSNRPGPADDPAQDVRAETALLLKAWRALREGDEVRALRVTTEHANRFPAGMLVEERRACRAIALCRLGRGAQARRAAQGFVRRHPRSVHESKVRAACTAWIDPPAQ